MLGEVFEVPKNHHRTLSLWKPCERTHQLVSALDIRQPRDELGVVPPLCRVSPLESEASESAVGEVDHGSSQVALKRRRVTEVLPPPEHLDEGVLDEVLSLVAITRQEISESECLVGVRLKEARHAIADGRRDTLGRDVVGKGDDHASRDAQRGEKVSLLEDAGGTFGADTRRDETTDRLLKGRGALSEAITLRRRDT